LKLSGDIHGIIFFNDLKQAHVILLEINDELVWAYNKSSGFYTTKLGYQDMLFQGDDDD
jgi:hypothetical protein